MSVNMGRGRGRLPQQTNGDIEPLRRPNIANFGRGRSVQPSQTNFASKTSSIEYAVSDPRVDSMVLFKALDEFLQDNPSNSEIESMIEKIFSIVVSSKTNCDCICKCLYLATKHRSLGDQLYITFFNALEKKFLGINAIKEENGTDGFWRFQMLFSSVCQFVRPQKIAPMSELVEGLKKLCLESIQPTCSERAKISAISIARCVYSMKLSNVAPSQIDNVISKLRELIHTSYTDTAALNDTNIILWFTLGLETSVLALNKLPVETVQYYCKLLGPEASMFNLVPSPALNLPKQTQPNYIFTDISYILNFI